MVPSFIVNCFGGPSRASLAKKIAQVETRIEADHTALRHKQKTLDVKSKQTAQTLSRYEQAITRNKTRLDRLMIKLDKLDGEVSDPAIPPAPAVQISVVTSASPSAADADAGGDAGASGGEKRYRDYNLGPTYKESLEKSTKNFRILRQTFRQLLKARAKYDMYDRVIKMLQEYDTYNNESRRTKESERLDDDTDSLDKKENKPMSIEEQQEYEIARVENEILKTGLGYKKDSIEKNSETRRSNAMRKFSDIIDHAKDAKQSQKTMKEKRNAEIAVLKEQIDWRYAMERKRACLIDSGGNTCNIDKQVIKHVWPLYDAGYSKRAAYIKK